MSRSMKGSRLGRRRAALERLEKHYAEFKAAGKDKEPRTSTRNGKIHAHKAVDFKVECERMEIEIRTLKSRINGGN